MPNLVQHMTHTLLFALALSTSLTACAMDTPDASPPDASPPDGTEIAPLPDLRFKFVGAFPAFQSDLFTNVIDGMTLTLTGEQAWSPFAIGGGDSWEMLDFSPTVPVAEMTSNANTTDLAGAPALIAAAPTGSVITAVDYTDDAFGMIVDAPVVAQSLNSTIGGVAAEASLPAYVATQAANHAVVTALGFDGTTIDVFSYAIPADTTAYETSVLTATLATIPAQASRRAQVFSISAWRWFSTTSWAWVT